MLCSVHEVHIDREQLEWLEGVLAASGDTPVALFTHAPPMGSGLQVCPSLPLPLLLPTAPS